MAVQPLRCLTPSLQAEELRAAFPQRGAWNQLTQRGVPEERVIPDSNSKSIMEDTLEMERENTRQRAGGAVCGLA